MKYIATILLCCLLYSAKGQSKGDTTPYVYLGISDYNSDLNYLHPLKFVINGDTVEYLNRDLISDLLGIIEKLSTRVDSLEKRPIMYLNSGKPSLWVKDSIQGFDVQIFPPLNRK